jgi:hypothetical protein
MDQAPLVEMAIKDGARLIDRLVEEGIGVTAACWLKEPDRRWRLYIVTPLVSEEGDTLEAYRQVYPVMRRMPAPFWLDSSDVTVIEPQHPIARAVQDLQRRYPGPGPIWYSGLQFGGLSVDGVYVYPPTPAPVK